MKIYTRDFYKWKFPGGNSEPEYFLNDKKQELGPKDNKDYKPREATEDSPALDLNHGPVMVVCMGVMQTEDVTERSIEQVRAELESGRQPHLKKFLDQLARGNELEPVLEHLGEGLKRMRRGYFRMVDEVFGDPSMQMPPPKTYLVSYDRIEERMKSLYDFGEAKDQNTFVTREAVDFVRKAIAPYLGEKIVQKEGSQKLKIENRMPTKDIVSKLQNIVFLGNSTGANFIVEVENVMLDTLERSGFSDKDKEPIMRSIRALGVGQLADYEHLHGPRFTSIYFEGINDLVSETLNPHKIRITQQELRQYSHPDQSARLNEIARQHYDTLAADHNAAIRAMVSDKNADLDAHHLPLTPESEQPFPVQARLKDNPKAWVPRQVFVPRPQQDNNRMLVLATLPLDRKRFLTRELMRPERFHTPGRPVHDPAMEEQFSHMLAAIADDKNGHNIAYFLTQGYPPFYLPALVQRAMKNMVAYPSLPEEEKQRFTAADFMTRNLVRYNVGQDGQFVGKQDMLQNAVLHGLNCANKQSSQQYASR